MPINSGRDSAFCSKIRSCVKTGSHRRRSIEYFFIQLLDQRLKGKAKVIVPDQEIVEFKEAPVFALLGFLHLRNEVNTLKSMTGAKKDSSSGVIMRLL